MGGKTSIRHFEPESRWQFVKQRCTTLPKNKILKKALPPGTILHTVFWDDTGVILVNFLHMRTTLNFGYCTKTLRSLDACLCQVCPQRKMYIVLLLHDSISTCRSVQTTLSRSSDWQCCSSLPKSHRFTPSDFWLFEGQPVRTPLYVDYEAVRNSLCQ